MTQHPRPVRVLAIDCLNAISLAAESNAYRLLRSYLLVPAGVIVLLLFLYAVHRVILLTTVNFPASVVCMILLLLVMLLLDRILGSRRTAAFARIIDVPLGFSLRWINTFFTPSFVLLPLSPAVGGAEVGKIAAVFILGFAVTMAFTSYFVISLQKILGTSKRAIVERAEEVPPPHYDEHSRRRSVSMDLSGDIELDNLDANTIGTNNSSYRSDQHIMEIERPEPAMIRHDEMTPEIRMNRQIDSEMASMGDADSTNSLDPIPTRLSHASYRQSKELSRSRTGNTISQVMSESLPEDDGVHNHTRQVTTERRSMESPGAFAMNTNAPDTIIDNEESLAEVPRGTESDSVTVLTDSARNRNPEPKLFLIGKPSPRAELMASLITQYLDTFLYTIVFLCVGLPVYFTTGYTLIAHSTFTILMLFIGLRLPPRVRRFIHPIFTCSGLTILGIYLMAVANHKTLNEELHAYSSGRTYLTLFGVPKYANVLPGAGDLLKTMLDVSIVALALPMYRYRGDLKQHFVLIIIPNVVVGLITFFAYPPLCYAIGISAERSIAFIGRSVTLALALPVIQALGGSESLVAVVAILSGIIGVLIGSYILKGLKVRDDDYLTRGITLGINSSAVATAHLLTIDPRASALSSLSFVMFGTTLIVLSAINPIVKVMRAMVGL